MLRSEFEKLTGLTNKAINADMYEAIEKIYMNDYKDDITKRIVDTTNKQTFCKTFYSLYRKTVSYAVSKHIKESSMEDKLDLIDGGNKLRDECDKILEEKTWLLINLLTA